jgi:preprotein translocase subunit SecE
MIEDATGVLLVIVFIFYLFYLGLNFLLEN